LAGRVEKRVGSGFSTAPPNPSSNPARPPAHGLKSTQTKIYKEKEVERKKNGAREESF
jgi:hypothetical protein